MVWPRWVLLFALPVMVVAQSLEIPRPLPGAGPFTFWGCSGTDVKLETGSGHLDDEPK